MKRLSLISMRSIAALVICVLLVTGCSSLIIHNDDNIAVVATKVTVRAVNCALTIFFVCASEWAFMEAATSRVWVGTGDIKGDNYKCQQEASSISSGATGYISMPVGKNTMVLPMNGGGGIQINDQLYHSCMNARGYRLVEEYEYDRWREKQANESVRDALGSVCVDSNTTIGTRVRRPLDGKMVKVTALYGNSPRCSGPATPILVNVEEVGEGESSARTVQSGGWMYDRGVKYANGMGVPQDDVRAYMWYSLAAPQLTGVEQRFAADGRDYVVRRMTPAQIAEAQRLAQQCQAQGLKGC